MNHHKIVLKRTMKKDLHHYNWSILNYFRELLVRHQDAFQAGNPFPDSFYNTSVKFLPFRPDTPSLTMDSTRKSLWIK